MSARKFGKLRLKDPCEVSPGSGKRLTWVCDCGREKSILVHGVMRDGTASCGRCNELSAEEVSKGFHGLRMKVPEAVSPASHRKAAWLCPCGRETSAQVRYVVSGAIKSCGRCNTVGKDDMAVRKFGRLRMKVPADVLSGSNKKVTWSCDCGAEADIVAFFVLNGRTKSCGNCGMQVRRMYGRDRALLQALRTPILPSQLPDWCPRALEAVTHTSRPFRAECRICGSEYRPKWSGVRAGVSLSCGCTSSRVSRGQQEVYEFLSGHVPCELEKKVGRLKYDVFVPSKGIVVEFNGTRWHSGKASRARDLRKYGNALAHGLGQVTVFEDEWLKGRPKVESLLLGRLGLLKPRSVRPSACEVRPVPSAVADGFYASHHYIGAAAAPVNYGVRLDGRLVACASFKAPTRQSRHGHELVRMSSDPAFRVHGIWSKVLSAFVADHSPKSVVSFSDNRLFDGRTYEALGFAYDGPVRPDYYWTKGSVRRHKSAMRKTAAERLTGKTEVELREAQGYRRIWDLGKKRWVLDLTGGTQHGPSAGPGGARRTAAIPEVRGARRAPSEPKEPT